MAFLGSRGRNGCNNDLRLGLGDTDQSLERIQAESNVIFACAVQGLKCTGRRQIGARTAACEA